MVHYVIYRNPRDYPGKYVMRRWRANDDGSLTAERAATVRDTLGEIRGCVPVGMVRVQRMPNDDPAILEVWL